MSYSWLPLAGKIGARPSSGGVHVEELALEVAQRAVVVGDVAGVDHEIEGDGLELRVERALIRSAAARVPDDQRSHPRAGPRRGRAGERAGPHQRLAAPAQLVTVGGSRGETVDRRRPLRAAARQRRAGVERSRGLGDRRALRRRHHHRPARRARRRPDQHRVVGGHALEIRAPRDHGCARLRLGRPAARPGRAGRDPLERRRGEIPGSQRGDVSGFVEVAARDGEGGRRSGDQRDDYEEGGALRVSLVQPRRVSRPRRPFQRDRGETTPSSWRIRLMNSAGNPSPTAPWKPLSKDALLDHVHLAGRAVGKRAGGAPFKADRQELLARHGRRTSAARNPGWASPAPCW